MVQIMAWYRIGDKPLPETLMVKFCITHHTLSPIISHWIKPIHTTMKRTCMPFEEIFVNDCNSICSHWQKFCQNYIPISIIRKWRLRNVRNVICKYESCLVCNEQGTLLDEMCPRLPIHRYKFIGPWEIWIKFEINIFQANHSDWWLKYLLWSCPQEWDECHWNVLMISQHRFRWWLGDVRQQAITWAKIDRDFFFIWCHKATMS